MNIRDALQKTIDYIEENLKAELSAEELANHIGFSVFHLYDIFSAYVGMPIGAFITKRRLKHAAYEAHNSINFVDLAMQYGFDTYPGFYKAFKREFGCSPKKYLTLNTPKKPKRYIVKEEANIIMTETQLRQLVSTHWDIDLKGETINCLSGGNDKPNTTWRIGNKYIFKTGKNIAGQRIHIAIAKGLKARGILAPTPIQTKEAEDLLVVDDMFCMLLINIEGEILSQEERYESSKRYDTGMKYGQAIGKLHQVLIKEDELTMNEKNIHDTVTNWALPETKQIMEQWGYSLPNSFFEDYLYSFTKLYPKLPKQLIHRDPNPSNIIFKDGEVSGFIDFEISEKNVRIFDPCYCATGILSETEDFEDRFDEWLEILAGIMKGYNEICSLSNEEKDAILYTIYSIQMIFIAWTSQFDNLKDLTIKNVQMLYLLWENRDKVLEVLEKSFI